MRKANQFERDVVEEDYEATCERIEESLAALQGQLEPEYAQTRRYGLFEDALMAAGYAQALDQPAEDVQRFLTTVAQVAPDLFRWRDTLTTQRVDLFTMEEEVGTDTSPANPWTLVRAIYAALATNNLDVASRLAALAPEAYHSDQVEVTLILDQYSHALQQAVGGKLQAAQDDIQRIMEHSQHGKDADNQYWLAQVSVLDALANQDREGFRQALADLSAVLKRYYSRSRYRNDPEAFLSLPLLGLAALAQQLGLSDVGTAQHHEH